MLTEIYIEALLVDDELADQVWGAWDAGEIDDQTAAWTWVYILLRDQRLLIGIPSEQDEPAPKPPVDFYT